MPTNNICLLRGLAVVVICAVLLGDHPSLAGAHVALPQPRTRSCGEVAVPGTPFPAFLVRASRTSCSSARAVLRAYARKPSGPDTTRAGGWRCRLDSVTTPWFYCRKHFARQGSPLAEAVHVSSRSAPPRPSSAGSAPTHEDRWGPGPIRLSLSPETPAVGEPIMVLITPAGSYEVTWWLCPTRTWDNWVSGRVGGEYPNAHGAYAGLSGLRSPLEVAQN
jgi:hypothetical protein